MALPAFAAPLAVRLLAAGAVLAVAAAARARRAPADVARDDALDRVEEGVAARTETAAEPGGAVRQTTLAGKWRRVVRLGRRGPGLSFEGVVVARGRVRPVKPE